MRAEGDISPLEWVGISIACVPIAMLAGFPFLIAPTFDAMFRDFGGAALPALTRLGLSPWLGPMLAVVAAAPVVASVVLRARLPSAQRRRLLILTYLLGGLALGLLVVAMYMPIFDLAGKIKAE